MTTRSNGVEYHANEAFFNITDMQFLMRTPWDYLEFLSKVSQLVDEEYRAAEKRYAELNSWDERGDDADA